MEQGDCSRRWQVIFLDRWSNDGLIRQSDKGTSMERSHQPGEEKHEAQTPEFFHKSVHGISFCKVFHTHQKTYEPKTPHHLKMCDSKKNMQLKYHIQLVSY